MKPHLPAGPLLIHPACGEVCELGGLWHMHACMHAVSCSMTLLPCQLGFCIDVSMYSPTHTAPEDSKAPCSLQAYAGVGTSSLDISLWQFRGVLLVPFLLFDTFCYELCLALQRHKQLC